MRSAQSDKIYEQLRSECARVISPLVIRIQARKSCSVSSLN